MFFLGGEGGLAAADLHSDSSALIHFPGSLLTQLISLLCDPQSFGEFWPSVQVPNSVLKNRSLC